MERASREVPKLPKVRYKREGSCKRCGKCCLNEDCKHLQFDEKGKATCLLYGKPERPDRCKRHPQAPPIIIEGCGYFFFDRWEKKKIGYMEV